MTLHRATWDEDWDALRDAAESGDVDALRDRLARGDDVDGRHVWGETPLVGACLKGRHECARILIGAGAEVDRANSFGWTALTRACRWGNHECAQALIDAGAAVDKADENGWTPLMHACNVGSYECTRALVDAHAELELTNLSGHNALMIACWSPPSYYLQSQCQGRIRCALAILEATAPIEEADFPDRAASLKLAIERLQQIEVVLASTHVIEDVPPLASVRALQTDAQDVVANFARDMFARAPPRRRSRRLAAKRSTVR
jgi:hypothetical protein